jgi:hypothetical protein
MISLPFILPPPPFHYTVRTIRVFSISPTTDGEIVDFHSDANDQFWRCCTRSAHSVNASRFTSLGSGDGVVGSAETVRELPDWYEMSGFDSLLADPRSRDKFVHNGSGDRVRDWGSGDAISLENSRARVGRSCGGVVFRTPRDEVGLLRTAINAAGLNARFVGLAYVDVAFVGVVFVSLSSSSSVIATEPVESISRVSR